MNKSLAFVFLILAATAEACKCVARTPQELFEAADQVFLGEVVSVSQGRDPQGHAPLTRASLQVEKSWKGIRGIRAQVQEAAGTDCSVGFAVGVRYLIYARRDGAVGFCGGTRRADLAGDVIQNLGPSIPLK